jgi:hypothetical protein
VETRNTAAAEGRKKTMSAPKIRLPVPTNLGTVVPVDVGSTQVQLSIRHSCSSHVLSLHSSSTMLRLRSC